MDSGVLDRLTRVVGSGGVLSTPEDLAVYSYDATFAEGLPGLVVLPETTEQTAEIVQVLAGHGIPIVGRGMGSGMAAGSIPVCGDGVVVCFTRMNRILEIDTANSTVHAEAGVVTATLQAAVEEHGLFYPPDPSSIRHSTIGGNVACNAGGPRCLKYGVTGNYVLGLTVVLADGRILRTGGKPIKDVTGYNLNGLFTGSEGTLGLITEALLRLVARPRHAKTCLAEFSRLGDASRAVNAILAAGIVPATLELMDQTAIECIEEAMHLGLPVDVEAILLVETDGSDEGTVAGEIEAAGRISTENGARSVKVARTESEREALWKARRSISPSLARKAPNKLGEDITVPRSAIPEIISRLRAISARFSLPIVIFGHAGDGNLHVVMAGDPTDRDEWGRLEAINQAIVEKAIQVGGTCTGEHGVGIGKRKFMQLEHGESYQLMKQIKDVIDPKGLMNPGKIF